MKTSLKFSPKFHPNSVKTNSKCVPKTLLLTNLIIERLSVGGLTEDEYYIVIHTFKKKKKILLAAPPVDPLKS